LQRVLENSFASPVVFSPLGERAGTELVEVTNYYEWRDQVKLIEEILPYLKEMKSVFDGLQADGKLQDHFYLNYNVNEIDFETLMLTSLARFALKGQEEGTPRLGLNKKEYLSFVKMATLDVGQGSHFNPEFVEEFFLDFQTAYGLHEVTGFKFYLSTCLKEHLAGYHFEGLESEDWKHLGGPILLMD
jgi:hypothetical protein